MSERRSVSQRDADTSGRAAETAPLALPVAIGTLLVIYGYLGGLWLTRHESTPESLALLRAWVNVPFGIGEDFGIVGIALLLITTGYQASAALRDSNPLADIVGVSRWSWLGPGSTLVALLTTTLLGAHWAIWNAEIGRLLCAASLALLGHIMHSRDSSRVGHWPATLLALGCLAIVVVTSESYPGLAEWWYPLAAVYGLLIFLLALHRGHRIATTSAMGWLASRGYPLAVGTGVLGYSLLTFLTPSIPTQFAYLVTLLTLGLCAEGTVRLRRALIPTIGRGGGHDR